MCTLIGLCRNFEAKEGMGVYLQYGLIFARVRYTLMQWQPLQHSFVELVFSHAVINSL